MEIYTQCYSTKSNASLGGIHNLVWACAFRRSRIWILDTVVECRSVMLPVTRAPSQLHLQPYVACHMGLSHLFWQCCMLHLGQDLPNKEIFAPNPETGSWSGNWILSGFGSWKLDLDPGQGSKSWTGIPILNVDPNPGNWIPIWNVDLDPGNWTPIPNVDPNPEWGSRSWKLDPNPKWGSRS